MGFFCETCCGKLIIVLILAILFNNVYLEIMQIVIKPDNMDAGMHLQ